MRHPQPAMGLHTGSASSDHHACTKKSPHSSVVDRALGSLRGHLGMDVAFVSEFVGEERIFRHVDTKAERSPIRVGEVLSLKNGYCRKIVEGRLPELIPDTSRLPEAMAIADTRTMPIGSHMSVPLRLGDGRLFGTLCCFSFAPDVSLNDRDLQLMRAFADLIATQIESNFQNSRVREEKVARITKLLRSNSPKIVYQPVFELTDLKMLGAEALARFPDAPVRSPDKWFQEAAEVGSKTQLELKAIRNAVRSVAECREVDWLYLGLNSSPETILSGGIGDATAGLPADRIVLEITEHDHVENYEALMRALGTLRKDGMKVAVDDAGSGYASMRHILNIQPDFIKLDVSLTRNIDRDKMRRALARALIEFSRETDCKIVAEGVESEAEMRTLSGLGVHAAQGYLLSRPLPFQDLKRLARVAWGST